MKSTTISELAKELGLSVSTVSRALNGKSVVREDTRQLVLEAAEKYSYVPNEIARSLKKSSTKTMAVVLPDISETFFGTIVKEIDRVVAREGYMIILADTHESADNEKKYLDMLYTRRVDALVLATVDCSGNTVKRFMESGAPVVFIDNVPELPELDAITVDNRKASRVAVECLVSRGHRQIAVIAGSEKETTGVERLAGYEEAMEEWGIPVNAELVVRGDYKCESGYLQMKRLLAQREGNPFTAVYIVSEKMTYGAMKAIRESGLSVPEDISVVGFDIHEMGMEPRQKLTSVRQPEVEIGRKVGELLLRRLDDSGEKADRTERKRLFLEPFLEEGKTVKAL
ncbi:LacI family DNA-binding transcriptional regulator [uncultured Acetatifactor sp.]|uniref:LacI family DNA-binding transcriptional regulator n=1 Tax=uncultured Acetatifactor sp. TaxID=1671927 RepID=UPI002611B3EB|nr:LacI family DNA-binding transcriptional regulator [uncultured Acetatifactor sp.]MCI8695295.1 LacI family transcriptional regulator [Lachnospiraceae bacterium]